MYRTKIPEIEKYLDLHALLEQILLRIRENLGSKLVGLYLYGSLVAGDFDYEISDIDLLAATENVIDENEFSTLEKMHIRLAEENPQWENRIEIAYVSLEALETFKTRRLRIANISPGEPFHFLDAGRDWLLNWYFVRENGVTLFGTSPKKIIAPVSKREFIEAVREQALERGKNVELAKDSRPFQAYLIMTVCRALYAIENGEQVSKRRATSWAQKRFPEYFVLIENAFVWREKYRDENVNHALTFPETKKFIDFIIEQIKV